MSTLEKLDNCPVCDRPLSQQGYDMQTCGTHFVGGMIKNHRKPYPALPGERASNQTEAAFTKFAKQPIVILAINTVAHESTFALVKFAFMAGAQYATDRCDAEHGDDHRRAPENQPENMR